MNEKTMQIKLSSFLEKKFRTAKVTNEYPLVHGTVDLVMELRGKFYLFELKEKINKRLLEQSKKHKFFGDKIFCVASKPKNKHTIQK